MDRDAGPGGSRPGYRPRRKCSAKGNLKTEILEYSKFFPGLFPCSTECPGRERDAALSSRANSNLHPPSVQGLHPHVPDPPSRKLRILSKFAGNPTPAEARVLPPAKIF